MNIEDFVTYKQAVKLGELGFDQECNYYYDLDKEIVPVTIPCILDSIKRIYVPTLAQAMKWVRGRGLFIDVWQSGSGYLYHVEENGNSNYNNIVIECEDDATEFNTYEEALSDAIDKSLEKIKTRTLITQEDKDLLATDLCARLPYKTMVKCGQEIMELVSVKKIRRALNDKEVSINGRFNIEYVKPYLFPVSSMTEELAEQYDSIFKQGDPNTCVKFIDWLNAHHFDYRGLIEKGLAIDATNLNIY